MNYRDERDALRGRVDGLEQELEDARRAQIDDATKRARIEQIEARLRETEANMHAMRQELGALRGDERPKKTRAVLWIGVAMVFVGALVSTLVLVRAPAPPPPRAQNFPTVAEPIPAPPPIPEIPTDDPLKAPTAVRQVKAQWTGKVTRSNALGLAPGAPCLVDATLESDGAKQRVAQLTVTCDKKTMYNSSDKLEGMSMTSAGMAEVPGKQAGTHEYAVNYNDTGARAGGRTQISLDTTHQQGSVWSEVVPIFRIDFSVSERSVPIQGEPLLPKKDYLEDR